MLIINLDDRQASQSLSRLLQNAQNSRTIMRGLATELETMTQENFENEAFGGSPWVRKKFGNGKTLFNEGELSGSISSQATSPTPPPSAQMWNTLAFIILVVQSHQNKNPILFLPRQTALQKSNQLHYPLAHFYPFPLMGNYKVMVIDG